ncbi:DUF2026 family protein [Thioclava sp. 15-R06ZXC-3]|uniref:DUF2026 family protein n=1 Tax=Thioclava arctica TaxID=3238301 RepID=A0ABV3TNG6_9RHOB
MSKKNAIRRGPCLLNAEQLKSVGDRVHKASIRAVTGGFYARGGNKIFTASGSLQDAVLPAAPLMAFAAAQILSNMGLQPRVIAGAAIWSVGSGDYDTLDHGIANPSIPSIAAARGDFHTWVICEGWLLDFAACALPAKLAQTHASQPFSTPRERWTRFPEVITHPLFYSMPDPLRDAHATYGYFKRRPELLSEVRSFLEDGVRAAEAEAERLPT